MGLPIPPPTPPHPMSTQAFRAAKVLLGPRTEVELGQGPCGPSAHAHLGGADNLLEEVLCILLVFCSQGDQLLLWAEREGGVSRSRAQRAPNASKWCDRNPVQASATVLPGSVQAVPGSAHPWGAGRCTLCVPSRAGAWVQIGERPCERGGD